MLWVHAEHYFEPQIGANGKTQFGLTILFLKNQFSNSEFQPRYRQHLTFTWILCPEEKNYGSKSISFGVCIFLNLNVVNCTLPKKKSFSPHFSPGSQPQKTRMISLPCGGSLVFLGHRHAFIILNHYLMLGDPKESLCEFGVHIILKVLLCFKQTPHWRSERMAI